MQPPARTEATSRSTVPPRAEEQFSLRILSNDPGEPAILELGVTPGL